MQVKNCRNLRSKKQEEKERKGKLKIEFEGCINGGGVFGAVGGVPVVLAQAPTQDFYLVVSVFGETKNALLKVE
ncbi:hypothetical protein P8452_51608 [Trifolium repens]|nr:hypothetical protein P8452_51608 [Trifolium repens]